MSEQYHQPEFNFPWNEDEQGYYLLLRTDLGVIELRQENTEIYTFTDYPEANHVWVEIDKGDDEVRNGFRMYEQDIDGVLGQGAFYNFCDDLRRRSFMDIVCDKPNDFDHQAFVEKFGREPQPIDRTEQIVLQAMKNLDAEWKYYSTEPDWGKA